MIIKMTTPENPATAVYNYTMIYLIEGDPKEHTWECKACSAEQALDFFEDRYMEHIDSSYEVMSIARGDRIGEWRFVPAENFTSEPPPNVLTLPRKR